MGKPSRGVQGPLEEAPFQGRFHVAPGEAEEAGPPLLGVVGHAHAPLGEPEGLLGAPGEEAEGLLQVVEAGPEAHLLWGEEGLEHHRPHPVPQEHLVAGLQEAGVGRDGLGVGLEGGEAEARGKAHPVHRLQAELQGGAPVRPEAHGLQDEVLGGPGPEDLHLVVEARAFHLYHVPAGAEGHPVVGQALHLALLVVLGLPQEAAFHLEAVHPHGDGPEGGLNPQGHGLLLHDGPVHGLPDGPLALGRKGLGPLVVPQAKPPFEGKLPVQAKEGEGGLGKGREGPGVEEGEGQEAFPGEGEAPDQGAVGKDPGLLHGPPVQPGGARAVLRPFRGLEAEEKGVPFPLHPEGEAHHRGPLGDEDGEDGHLGLDGEGGGGLPEEGGKPVLQLAHGLGPEGEGEDPLLPRLQGHPFAPGVHAEALARDVPELHLHPVVRGVPHPEAEDPLASLQEARGVRLLLQEERPPL